MLTWRVFPFFILICISEVGSKEAAPAVTGGILQPTTKDIRYVPKDVMESCSRTVFGNIPDPEDCSRYYVCTFHTALSKQCPNDEFFDIHKWSCAPSRTVVCTKREPLPETEFLITPETTSTTTTTTTTTTATTTTTDNVLEICRKKAFGRTPDPEDCSKFYVCTASTPISKQCPKDQLYDVSQWSCALITSVDCQERKLQPEMVPLPIALAITTTTTSITTTTTTAAHKSCKRIVCVFKNQDVPTDFIYEHIPVDYCTHLLYDSATLVGNGLTNQFSHELVERGRKGLYAQFNGWKRDNPDLKTLLRVSVPWGKLQPFHSMVATKDNRSEFIDAAIAFVQKHQFDGLDIAWTYPTTHGGSGKDKPNFSALLKETSEAFQKHSITFGHPKFLLSASVHPFDHHIYDVHAMARYLDMANVIGFGLRGPWNGKMDHHSPLGGSFGMASAMKKWVANGMPAAKLNLGISFNGVYAHVQSKTDHSRLGEVVNVARPLYTPSSSGQLLFRELCKLTSDKTYVHQDEELKAPYFFRDGLWLGYDDKSSVYEKGKYAMENGHGVWVHMLQSDDYNGTVCAMGEYPLLRGVVSGCAMSM